MKKAKIKRAPSTFEMEMLNPERKKRFEEKYSKLLLQEALLKVMAENSMSIRDLARESGLSKSIVQGVRSGEKENLTLASLGNIFHVYGYSIVAKKGKKELILA